MGSVRRDDGKCNSYTVCAGDRDVDVDFALISCRRRIFLRSRPDFLGRDTSRSPPHTHIRLFMQNYVLSVPFVLPIEKLLSTGLPPRALKDMIKDFERQMRECVMQAYVTRCRNNSLVDSRVDFQRFWWL